MLCVQVDGFDAADCKKICSLLEKYDVAYDIGAYRDAPAGLRIWGGATVEEASRCSPVLVHSLTVLPVIDQQVN